MEDTIIDDVANMADILVKLKIETDKVKQSIKHLIDSNVPEAEFTNTVLQLWNQGRFRMVSFTTVVELVRSRFVKPMDAYTFISKLSTSIDKEEIVLADMVMFHFLYEAFPLEDVLDPKIPAGYKKRVLGLFMNLFHVDMIPYNNLFKVTNPRPCPYEDALIKNIRRIALSWLTVPVYVFDSQKRYRCVPTNMILDIGRFPGNADGGYDAFNKTIGAIHGEKANVTFTQKEICTILKSNRIAFDQCTIVGLPHYTERGLSATRIYTCKPSNNPEKPTIESMYDIVLTGKDDIALDILYSLCTTGSYAGKDDAISGNISTTITKRVSPILSAFKDVVIKKKQHESWYLYNPKTRTKYDSLPLVLYFPMIKNRVQKN